MSAGSVESRPDHRVEGNDAAPSGEVEPTCWPGIATDPKKFKAMALPAPYNFSVDNGRVLKIRVEHERNQPARIGDSRIFKRRNPARPRPASTTSAAAAPNARCRISTTCCSSAPRSRAIRWKAIAKCATDVTMLGTRFAKKPIEIKTPVTIAGMSFGALSARPKSVGRGATQMGTSTTTGDGGMTRRSAAIRRPGLPVSALALRHESRRPAPADAIEWWSAGGANRAAAACCWARRSERVAKMRNLPIGIDQRSACRHPTGPGRRPQIKIGELREITDWEKPIYVKGRRRAALLRHRAGGEGRRRRRGAGRHAGRHGGDAGCLHRACRHPDPGRHPPGGAGAAGPRHASQGAAHRLGGIRTAPTWRRRWRWRRCGRHRHRGPGGAWATTIRNTRPSTAKLQLHRRRL